MRVPTRPFVQRILAIDSAVRGWEWPNARTLARELEVGRRTIQRDLVFLRRRLRAPLKFDPVRNFKVQRVRRAEESGASCRRPSGFDAKEFKVQSFGTIRATSITTSRSVSPRLHFG